MLLKDGQCSLFLGFCFQISTKNENFQFFPILFVAMVQNFAKKKHWLSLIGNRHNNDHPQ